MELMKRATNALDRRRMFAPRTDAAGRPEPARQLQQMVSVLKIRRTIDADDPSSAPPPTLPAAKLFPLARNRRRRFPNYLPKGSVQF